MSEHSRTVSSFCFLFLLTLCFHYMFDNSYDPVTNQWKVVCPMLSKRLGVAVAVVNGSIYAIGGSDGSSPLATVER